jgi:hypothetical protein
MGHALALLSGAEDAAAFTAQPSRHGAAAAAELITGMRAELAGQREAALASYAAALARPPWQRDFTTAMQDFLAWRMSALAPGAAGSGP